MGKGSLVSVCFPSNFGNCKQLHCSPLWFSLSCLIVCVCVCVCVCDLCLILAGGCVFSEWCCRSRWWGVTVQCPRLISGVQAQAEYWGFLPMCLCWIQSALNLCGELNLVKGHLPGVLEAKTWMLKKRKFRHKCCFSALNTPFSQLCKQVLTDF